MSTRRDQLGGQEQQCKGRGSCLPAESSFYYPTQNYLTPIRSLGISHTNYLDIFNTK